MSASQRVSRGFHRLGLFLAAILFVICIAVSVFLARDYADCGQHEHAMLVCANEKLATLPKDALKQPKQTIAGAEPWEQNWELDLGGDAGATFTLAAHDAERVFAQHLNAQPLPSLRMVQMPTDSELTLTPEHQSSSTSSKHSWHRTVTRSRPQKSLFSLRIMGGQRPPFGPPKREPQGGDFPPPPNLGELENHGGYQ
jgi:hypothetical protein